MWIIVYPDQPGVPKYWLYAWTTAEPSSTPQVEASTHWRKRTLPPPLTPAYLFHSAQDVDAPVQIPQEAPIAPWIVRPISFQSLPPVTWSLYQTGATNENSVAPEEPGRETWTPRPLQGAPPPLTIYYYTAGFFRDSAVEQPDVPFWRSRFLPPQRFITPLLQGLYHFGQDTSETAPSDHADWLPPPSSSVRFLRTRSLWTPATDLTSTPPQEGGRAGWVPRPLWVEQTPRGLFFYQRQGKESDQSTAENIQGARDTWRALRVESPRSPRALYLYYFSNTAQDDSGPPPETGRDQWVPRWIRVELPPRGKYLYYLQWITADITFTSAQEPGWHGWTPKPLTVLHAQKWIHLYYQSNTAQDTSSAIRLGRVTGLIDKPWHTTTIVR